MNKKILSDPVRRIEISLSTQNLGNIVTFDGKYFSIFVRNLKSKGMIPEFEPLREDEIEVILKSPVYVAILIAGADGKIDKSEKKEAIEVARNKQSRAREQLAELYKLVGERFEDNFTKLIDELPSGTEARISAITTELRKLNFILPKIDKNFSVKFIASLKDLAKKIAEASGGVLGYLSISYEESRLMELKMIKDIE